jgi:RNA polymerase sigma factor (sigma-70 family)
MNISLDDADDDSHISRIQTRWSIVLQAKQTGSELAGALARAELVSRYNGAVYRYLRRLLGNAQDAEDLSQDIALKILDGAFAGANPVKGRFRDYVKAIVINSVRSHRSKEARNNARLRDLDEKGLNDLIDKGEAEDVWEESVRDDLISQALKRLADYDQNSTQPYSALLNWKLQNPFADSAEMARFLERQTGKSVTAANARKLLQRSREKLAELLLSTVRDTLPADSQNGELLQEHLIALGIHEICLSALS